MRAPDHPIEFTIRKVNRDAEPSLQMAPVTTVTGAIATESVQNNRILDGLIQVG